MKRKAISYKGKVVFEKVNMNPKFKRFQKFFKEDEACFIYMNKGSFYFRTPTNCIEIRSNEAIVAKCGSYFIEPSSAQHAEQEMVVFGAYFYPEMVKSFFQADLKLAHFQRNYDVSPAMVTPLMKIFIDSIEHLIENPLLADDNLIVSKIKELLILLGKTERSIHDFVHSLFTPYEYDFKEIIEKNAFTNLSITELATLCGCSISTFKRKFKSYFNQPPAQYLLQRKLDRSYHLLKTTSNPISDIAFDSGFENVSHFNKAFKKQYGTTPSNARVDQKGNHLSF